MDRQILYDFFRGTATGGQRRQVLEWVEADPANLRSFIEQRQLFDTLVIAGPDISRHLSGQSRGAKSPVARMWMAASVAAVVFIASLYIAYDRRIPERNYAVVNVPASQRTEVVLPDGTTVTLNGSSRLEYPSYFDKKERRVRISGEAFFEVTHDPSHPFVVETRMCDVEVLGTRFNVEAYDDSDLFRTSLVDGRVMVCNKMVAGDRVVLEADQQAEFTGSGRLMKSDIPSHEGSLWRQGLIAFKDASFEEILRLFEKYYDVTIVVEGRMPTNTFTGKIPVKSGLDHGFWILQQNAAFDYKKDEDFKTVYIY
ncbi:MAG: FecR domain-containing protein [Rikenellaceae bacterium]|nr:FecR domain-containing protein [Rikenellaceae bacterium]